MKKLMTAIVVAMTVVSLSGCFPIFVPVHGGHHNGHHHGYYRGY